MSFRNYIPCFIFFILLVISAVHVFFPLRALVFLMVGLCVFGLGVGWKLNKDLRRKESELERERHLREVKSRFFANVSHEIRNPLSSIVGFANILKNKNPDPEERTRYVNIICRAGEDLTDVINDVLDLSKVESGHFCLRKTDISSQTFLNEIQKLLKPSCDENKVKFNLWVADKFPLSIYTDPLRLRQILMNILGNAIKFSLGGKVHLAARHDGHFLIFDIYDTGIGISALDQERIFRPFEQGSPQKVHPCQGTGLGVPLSKSLAELLGGDLKLINSETGKGSHFRVTISYEPAQEPQLASLSRL